MYILNMSQSTLVTISLGHEVAPSIHPVVQNSCSRRFLKKLSALATLRHYCSFLINYTVALLEDNTLNVYS